VRRLLLLVPIGLLAVACGGSSSAKKPFLPEPTASCLRTQGFTVSTRQKDLQFVFQLADNGGLVAHAPKNENTLQIAFAAGPKAAVDEYRAIARVAPKELRLHIRDVASIARNAVLLWTIAPTQKQTQTVLDCLKS
jgi:hypothetical protein